MSKKTLVIGASEKPDRYSNMAIRRLRAAGHPVVALGLKEGRVEDVDIHTGYPAFADIHTVTLYVGPQHQDALFDYLGGIHPRRVIFNPGTENESLMEQLRSVGVEVNEACTLVMLSTGQY
jgi:predicted CoA-binding protein